MQTKKKYSTDTYGEIHACENQLHLNLSDNYSITL